MPAATKHSEQKNTRRHRNDVKVDIGIRFVIIELLDVCGVFCSIIDAGYFFNSICNAWLSYPFKRGPILRPKEVWRSAHTFSDAVESSFL